MAMVDRGKTAWRLQTAATVRVAADCIRHAQHSALDIPAGIE
jgi:hypothetical protein